MAYSRHDHLRFEVYIRQDDKTCIQACKRTARAATKQKATVPILVVMSAVMSGDMSDKEPTTRSLLFCDFEPACCEEDIGEIQSSPKLQFTRQGKLVSRRSSTETRADGRYRDGPGTFYHYEKLVFRLMTVSHTEMDLDLITNSSSTIRESYK